MWFCRLIGCFIRSSYTAFSTRFPTSSSPQQKQIDGRESNPVEDNVGSGSGDSASARFSLFDYVSFLDFEDRKSFDFFEGQEDFWNC